MDDLIQMLFRAAEEIGRGVYSPGHAALMQRAAKEIEAAEVRNGTEKNLPKARFVACFHGETWYKCPHCGTEFEYFDAFHEHGFKNFGKVNGGLAFVHDKCGGKFSIM